MLWFAIELSSYVEKSLQVCSDAGLPVELLEPAEAARASRPSASTASRRCSTMPRAAWCRRARPPVEWPVWRAEGIDVREGACVRLPPTASSSSPTAARAGRPGAHRHRCVDERPAGRADPLDPAGQRLPARAHRGPAGLDVRPRRLRARRRRGGGLKVGGHAIGADVDPDDRPRALLRPRRSSDWWRRPAAATGPAVAGGRRAGARRRRVLLRAHADRDRRRGSPRRPHGRVRGVLGPRFQVRAHGREGRRRSRARTRARGRPHAVPAQA